MTDSTGPKISSWAMVIVVVDAGEDRGPDVVAGGQVVGLLGRRR
jgi:hypothetical protein